MKNSNKYFLLICVLLLCSALLSLNVFASVEGVPGGVTIDFAEDDTRKTETVSSKEEAPATEADTGVKESAGSGAEAQEQEKDTNKNHGLVDFIADLKKSGDFLASLASGNLAPVYSVLLLIASLAVCFFAYRFVKYCVGLSCFGIGIFATVYVSDKLSLLTSGKNKVICLLCALLFGIILAAVAYCLPKAGIFFFSGFSVYVLLSGLKTPFPVALVLAIVVAVVAALLVRVAIIVISSGIGGLISGAVICSFIKDVPLEYLHIPLGLILFVLGMSFQFSGKKGKKHRDNTPSAETNKEN